MYRVYYRTRIHNRKLVLHCSVEDTEDYIEAEQAVLEQLFIHKEYYILPVLVLIKGGKH